MTCLEDTRFAGEFAHILLNILMMADSEYAD